MKQYDSESIYKRLKSLVLINGNLAKVAEDSTINAVLKSNAETHAEVVRYMEYLLAEKKWDTAQNLSSIVRQSKIVGYVPKRKISAIGEIIITHDERILGLGTELFNLDAESEEDATPGVVGTASGSKSLALRPWSALKGDHSGNYGVTAGDIFATTDGTQFIALVTKSIKPYTTTDPNRLNSLGIQKDGYSWEGYKYLRIPVIQGIRKTKSIQLPTNPDQNFTILGLESSYIEDGSNNYSKNFIKVTMTGGTTIEASLTGEWLRVPSILYYGPYDKVYETFTSDDMRIVYFKFGNGITGAKPIPGGIVTINYLETKGELGNVTRRFKVTEIVSMTDNLSVSGLSTLYSTNNLKIKGGASSETIEQIRTNAPLNYLEFYTIGTLNSYETLIKKNISSIGNVKAFSGVKYSPDGSGSFFKSDVVYLTAVDAVGDGVIDTDSQDLATKFLNDALLLIGDRKSPTDSLQYKNPAIINFRLNTRIVQPTTSSETDSSMLIYVKNALSSYTILNRNFNDAYYQVDVTSKVKSIKNARGLPAVQDATFLLENVITIDLVNSMQFIANSRTIRFNFQFDQVFGQDTASFGFKNFIDNQKQYIIRADLVWTSDSSKNRTLLLLDSRSNSSQNGPNKLRTAQYAWGGNDLIYSNLVVSDYVSRIKTPIEIEYYETSSDGAYIKKVTASSAIESNFSANTRFIGPDYGSSYTNGVKVFGTSASTIPARAPRIYFDEFAPVSEEPETQTFGTGYISIPCGIQTFTPISSGSALSEKLAYFDDCADANEALTYINSIKSSFSIKIYAEPKLSSLSPDRPNVIFNIPEEEIIVKLGS